MISVCFITKDEEQWLAGCLDQLAGFVSETIVVDTGSSDRTLEIAKSRGAKIFQFPWTGSFSEARNFSLSKATQPWILKIDPDERIERRDLEKLVSLTSMDADAIRCRTRTYTNSPEALAEESFRLCRREFPNRELGYRGYKEIVYCRMFRNLPGVTYTGLVHEDVEPSIGRISKRATPIFLAEVITFHNYGWDAEVATQKSKNVLYRGMMERELCENPKNWFVLFELGSYYYQAQQYELAANTFERAYELNPKQPSVLINLGHVLTLIGQRDRGEAYLREALILEPNNPNIWLNFALSRSDASDFEYAQECFQKAITLKPDSLVTWRAYGQCLAKKGDLSNAEVALRTALDKLPSFTDAKIDLAIVVASQGKKEEGAALLKESLIEDPANERAGYFLKQIEAVA